MYTYQLSYTGSDYVELLVTNPVTLKGEWVENTFIFREKIDKLRINKALNTTIFEELKDWFVDPTKLDVPIYVKILKDNIQESLHWFGIKWGEIDYDKTFYEVSPLPYDLYSRYLELNMEKKAYGVVATAYVDLYNFASGNFPYLDTIGNLLSVPDMAELLEDTIKNRIYENSGLPVTEIVSSLLWGDNYEDSTTVTVTNGLLIDYVTGVYSRLRYACFAGTVQKWKDLTIKDCFEMLRIFQIYPYFDSNNKLRFEHVSYFVDKLNNNAENILVYDFEQNFKYKDSELCIQEKIEMYDDGTYGSEYDDFRGLPIIYSGVRNRPDIETKIYSFNYYTNLTEYQLDITKFTSVGLLCAGYMNFVMNNWVNVDIGTWSNTGHTFNIGHSTGQYCKSKDFNGSNAVVYTIKVGATTLTGSMKFGIYKRSTNGLISDEVAVNTTGVTTGSLTLSETPTDCYLRLTSTDDPSTFIGYVLLYTAAENQFYNPLGTGILANDIINADFSIAIIMDKYWKDYRISKEGNMNGVADVAFNSTQFNLKRKEIIRFRDILPNALYGVFLYGLFDGNLIARIEAWTRNLDTGYINLELTYPEEDGTVYLTDDDGELLTDEFGVPLTA